MQTIPRRTLTEAVTDALRERLLAGEWAVGTPLRQESLAAELGVSRIPLREALQRLEAEGIVTLLPHRGAVVAPLEAPDVSEIFELRALLETDLTRRAVPHLTADDLARMKAHAQAFEEAVAAGDIPAWGDANRRFHEALYAPANRPRTMELVARLLSQCDRFVRLQLTLTHGMPQAVKEHRAILAAARARDTVKATRLIRDHILKAGHGLADALAQHRPSETVR